MLANEKYIDRFGNEIILSIETEKHIIESHPEVIETDEIEKTLGVPDLLVKSTKHPQSILYYRLIGNKWYVVVVKKTEDGIFITTGHYESRLSRGEWLWRNPEFQPTQKELERNLGSEPPTDFPKLCPDDIEPR